MPFRPPPRLPFRGLACLLLIVSVLPARAADFPGAWLQYVATGGLELRAIVPPGQPCPAMTADGQPLAVVKRGAPDAAYPIQVCTAAVAGAPQLAVAGAPQLAVAGAPRLAVAGAPRLAVAGLAAPRPVGRLDRIVVLGDTGCRLKGRAVQDCNLPAAWTFDTVARLAAARKPDLVIHVGDYHYRETPCPPDRPGCAGSPVGDNWATWKADFFDPAAPLLAAAPLLLVRGNHELCSRGGIGWFRLLDPGPDPACQARTDPFALRIGGEGGQQFLMLDSADADDQTAAPEAVAAWRAQFIALLAQAGPHAWLLTHRPVWALAEFPGVPPGTNANATLQAAIRDLVPPGLDLVLSGHIHDFTAYDFGPTRPAQLVVGEGGTTDDAIVQPLAPGVKIDGLAIRQVTGFAEYGYLLLDRAPGGWTGTVMGLDDRALATCRLRGRAVTCRRLAA